MPRHLVVPCLFALAIAPLSPAEDRENAKGPTEIIAFIPSQVETGRYAALREEISACLASATQEGPLSVAVRDERVAQLLYAHEIIRRAGAANLTKLSMPSAEFRRFLSAFLSDREWMESYLSLMDAGDVVAGLRAMSEVFAAEGSSSDFARNKALVCAVGAAWSGRNALHFQEMQRAGKASPLSRYRLFCDAQREGRLHPAAREMGCREWEFVVAGFLWDDASIAWLNRNVSLPSRGYADGAWSEPTERFSPWGDSTGNPLSLLPWKQCMSDAENAARHGGAQVALQLHAALAHGVPAVRLSQRGRTAVSVRLGPGCWSGQPEGVPQYPVWGGAAKVESVGDLALAETIFADRDAMSQSIRLLALSRAFADSMKNTPGAMRAASEAVDASPRNLIAYAEIAGLLGENDSSSWSRLAEKAAGQAHGDLQGRPLFRFAYKVATEKLSEAGEAFRLRFIQSTIPSLLRLPASGDWEMIPALDQLAASLSGSGTEKVAEALIDGAARRPNDPGAVFALKWAAGRVASGQMTPDAFFRIYRDYFVPSFDRPGAPGNVRAWAERSLTQLLGEAAKAPPGKRDLLPFAQDEHLRLFAGPRLASQEDAEARKAGKKDSARLVWRPFEAGRPKGEVVSLRARFVDNGGGQYPERLHFLFSGDPSPYGFFGGAFRAPGAKPATFVVQLQSPAVVTGVFLAGDIDGTPMAAQVSLSEDGKVFSPIGKKVIPRAGRWTIEVPPTRTQYLKLEARTPGNAIAYISNFVVFGNAPKEPSANN